MLQKHPFNWRKEKAACFQIFQVKKICLSERNPYPDKWKPATFLVVFLKQSNYECSSDQNLDWKSCSRERQWYFLVIFEFFSVGIFELADLTHSWRVPPPSGFLGNSDGMSRWVRLLFSKVFIWLASRIRRIW